MIGYLHIKSNDVHVFFEKDELDRAEKGEDITGLLFCSPEPDDVVPLTARIGVLNMQLANVDLIKEEDVLAGAELVFVESTRERLLERGKTGTHQGYRKITLVDTNKPNVDPDISYSTLDQWRQDYERSQTS